MCSRIAIAVGLAVLFVPAVAVAQQPGPSRDDAHNWSAIAACGAIDNAGKRHACMDGVLRDAGILTDAKLARNSREEFGRTRDTDKPAKVPRPAPAAAAARAENIDQLVTTIKSVSTFGYRQLRVTTADGSVWDQTQSAQLGGEPQPGDGFAVERASLGSYMCRFGRSNGYRCKRVD